MPAIRRGAANGPDDRVSGGPRPQIRDLTGHGPKRCLDRTLSAEDVPIEIDHSGRESQRAPRAGMSLLPMQVGEFGIVNIRRSESELVETV
jgi:hypothetical protein